MQGLFYVLTFVGCLIALIIIDKFVNRGIKEEFLKKLEDDWGKVNQSKLKEEEQTLPDKDVNESLKSQIIDTSTLEFAKNYKIDEMKDMCNKAITDGVDVMLSDGQIYHFDLTIEDQLNLQNVQYQLLQNQTSIPFHSKNGSFKYYDASDLILILTQANRHILYHNAYFNSLKSYIKSIEKIDQINSINYGISIPNQYKSEVLHQLEK